MSRASKILEIINKSTPHQDYNITEDSLNTTYSAATGLYVYTKPTKASVDLIRSRFEGILPVTSNIEGVHCTIIKSDYPINAEVVNKNVINFAQDSIDRVFTAQVIEVTHFVAKNGRTFLFLELDSTDLQDAFNKWIELGAVNSYGGNYRPHITLIDGIELTPELEETLKLVNDDLRLNPFDVMFSSEYATDTVDSWKLED